MLRTQDLAALKLDLAVKAESGLNFIVAVSLIWAAIKLRHSPEVEVSRNQSDLLRELLRRR